MVHFKCSNHGTHRDRSKGMRVIKSANANNCQFQLKVVFSHRLKCLEVVDSNFEHNHKFDANLVKQYRKKE